jgi:hypothetical protein
MTPFQNRALSRRTFLRGAGVAMAIPLLDAMTPAVAAAGATAVELPRRMLAIQTNLGILPQYFFPKTAGRDYESTPYLEKLRDFRDQMTVFSGVSHPDVDGGHAGDKVFLTAAPHPSAGGFKNSVSLDQLAAEQIGPSTRFPTLSLQIGRGARGLSYTRSGVMLPTEKSPANLYRRMFVQGSASEVKSRVDDLRRGRSMLDFVQDSARRLNRQLAASDRDKMEHYFTSVRELETRLLQGEAWEHRPKPKVAAAQPQDVADHNEFIAISRLMYDAIRLALETDSTRLITVFVIPTDCVPNLPGVSHETHSLTHHGNRPEVLNELRTIEEAQFDVLAELLAALHDSKEQGQSLLDRTMVLYGTCMGSANAHSNVNLPTLLAGGGFKHGQHLAFDAKNNYPLPNLFVSMLQRLGVEADRFASSTGTMRGLEMA